MVHALANPFISPVHQMTTLLSSCDMHQGQAACGNTMLIPLHRRRRHVQMALLLLLLLLLPLTTQQECAWDFQGPPVQQHY
jgi:hypothetical protein